MGARPPPRTYYSEGKAKMTSRPMAWPPAPPLRRTRSRYVEMLLSTDQISRAHNILAGFFAWLLLAGFIVFPATFATLETALGPAGNGSASLTTANVTVTVTTTAAAAQAQIQAQAGSDLAAGVRALPLLVVGAVTSGVGVLGMAWLYAVHRHNYVWLVGRLFITGATNAAAGLISTLTGVYSTRHGRWSDTAVAAGIAETACLCTFGGLFALYNFVLLRRVRERHEIEDKVAGVRLV